MASQSREAYFVTTAPLYLWPSAIRHMTYYTPVKSDPVLVEFEGPFIDSLPNKV